MKERREKKRSKIKDNYMSCPLGVWDINGKTHGLVWNLKDDCRSKNFSPLPRRRSSNDRNSFSYHRLSVNQMKREEDSLLTWSLFVQFLNQYKNRVFK